MKYNNVDSVLLSYLKSNNVEVPNTNELLVKLKPSINNKCNQIRQQREQRADLLIFILSLIGVLFVGITILFPEIIDFTDEIIAFGGYAFIIVISTVIIYFITSTMTNSGIKYKNI